MVGVTVLLGAYAIMPKEYPTEALRIYLKCCLS